MNTPYKLIAIYIAGVNPENGEVYILNKNQDLKKINILFKDTKKDTFTFICRESLKDLGHGTRHKVFHEENTCYIQMHNLYKLGAYAFCEGNYPSNRVIYEALSKSLEAFTQEVKKEWQIKKEDQDYKVIGCQKIFKDYQDVKNVSKVHEAQDEADKLGLILHDNIKKLLERQGDLDQLIEKSRDLNAASRQFLKDTNKLDRSCCCTIF